MRQTSLILTMGAAGRVRRGLTLIESIILLVILSIVALGAGVGLQALARNPSANDAALGISNKLVDKMEQLRATPFDNLAVGTTTENNIVAGGKSYSRMTNIALADADQNGTADPDFKQITVSMGGQSLTVWVANPKLP